MNIELEIKDIKHDLNYAKKCEYDHVTLDVYKVQALLTAYEKEKEKNKDMSCDLTETRADNIDESTMLKQIKLKLQEKNIPIETLLAEFERLEDLEDDLTIVYLNGVYDGEKKVKDKIKAKIEELKDGTYDAKIILQSLLEKE